MTYRRSREKADAAGHPFRRVLEALYHGLRDPDQLVRDLGRDLAQQRVGRWVVLLEAAARHLGADDDIVDRDCRWALLEPRSRTAVLNKRRRIRSRRSAATRGR